MLVPGTVPQPERSVRVLLAYTAKVGAALMTEAERMAEAMRVESCILALKDRWQG